MDLELKFYGDPVLRMKASPVDEITPEIIAMCEEMIQLMYKENGIGLAGPQVGVSLRIFAMDVSEERNAPEVLINPVLSNPEGDCVFEEGCLSFPGIYGNVDRPETITIKGTSYKGGEVEMTLSGIEARVVQHEFDHLDGVLFIDRMKPTHKIVLRSRLKKLKKQTQENLKS